MVVPTSSRAEGGMLLTLIGVGRSTEHERKVATRRLHSEGFNLLVKYEAQQAVAARPNKGDET